jgi:hypothetical protein
MLHSKMSLRRSRAERSPGDRAVVSPPKSLVRDVSLLLVGAAISAFTAFGTTFLQAKVHREDVVSERGFALLREAIDFNAVATGQLIASIETVAMRVDIAESELRQGKPFPLKVKSDLVEQALKVPEFLSGYDARAEALTNMLHVYFPNAKVDLRLAENKKKVINTAPGVRDWSDKTTANDLALMRDWLKPEVEHARSEQKRINSELAAIGRTLLLGGRK